MRLAVRAVLLALVLIGDAASASPTSIDDGTAVPHLKDPGQEAFRKFSGSEIHRAFAIAPGGAWSWAAGAPARETAEDGALGACRAKTSQKCVLYAVDDEVVFNARLWTTLWGPYKTSAEAQQAAVGVKVGERFPDLSFTDPDGKAKTLAGSRGKLVVLHFWGSWCTPCRHEMPDLQKLRDGLKDRSDISFVLLQAREPFAVSRQWAQQQGVHLPLFDSGNSSESDASFSLADGSRVKDRVLSGQFPTTYVLDRYGVVLFHHIGAVPHWSEYAAFLRDAAAKSGR